MRTEVVPHGIEWEQEKAGSGDTGRARSRAAVRVAAVCGFAGLAAGFGLGRVTGPTAQAGAAAPLAPTTIETTVPVPWTTADLPSTPDAAERWLEHARSQFEPSDLPRTPDAIEHWLDATSTTDPGA
jgi:hypothetical protein